MRRLVRNTNQDMKLFAVSLLLSSFLIYNSMGQIDERAIENMALVSGISEIFRNKDGSKSRGVESYLPNFLWVLRDFVLDLKGRSAK